MLLRVKTQITSYGFSKIELRAQPNICTVIEQYLHPLRRRAKVQSQFNAHKYTPST